MPPRTLSISRSSRLCLLVAILLIASICMVLWSSTLMFSSTATARVQRLSEKLNANPLQHRDKKNLHQPISMVTVLRANGARTNSVLHLQTTCSYIGELERSPCTVQKFRDFVLIVARQVPTKLFSYLPKSLRRFTNPPFEVPPGICLLPNAVDYLSRFVWKLVWTTSKSFICSRDTAPNAKWSSREAVHHVRRTSSGATK